MMRRSFLLVVLPIILNSHLNPSTLFAQSNEMKILTRKLKGSVVDIETQFPIKGATVKWKSSYDEDFHKGTISNNRGEFEIVFQANWFTGTIVYFQINAEDYQGEHKQIILLDKMDDLVFKLKKIPEIITHEFKIQYRNPRDIIEMIKPHIEAKVSYSENLRTITATAAMEQMIEIDKIIGQYDIPLKTIWLEVKLIQASENGRENPKFSKEIEHIIKQLNSVFKFGHYEIIGRADAMGLEGSILSFSTAFDPSSKASAFSVRTKLEYINDIIKLNELHIQIQYPTKNELATTVNVANGETVILGASRGDPQKGSIITVVTAKVME